MIYTDTDTDTAKASSESLAVLAMHFALYPLMTPQDAVKLLYQSEFGCGHFAPSPERAREMLNRECAGIEKDENHAKTEPIGGGFVRVHLEPLVGDEQALSALADAFVRSAETPCESSEGFGAKLDALKSMAESGKTPFSALELAGFMAEYEKLGRPAVHHSETYRKNYHPAYRVVRSELLSSGAQ